MSIYDGKKVDFATFESELTEELNFYSENMESLSVGCIKSIVQESIAPEEHKSKSPHEFLKQEWNPETGSKIAEEARHIVEEMSGGYSGSIYLDFTLGSGVGYPDSYRILHWSCNLENGSIVRRKKWGTFAHDFTSDDVKKWIEKIIYDPKEKGQNWTKEKLTEIINRKLLNPEEPVKSKVVLEVLTEMESQGKLSRNGDCFSIKSFQK